MREHPDVDCEPTPDEKRAKRVREAFGERDKQTWWNLPVSIVAHLWTFGGAWQGISSIFIFYIVACELARTYYVCSQNLLFLDVASRHYSRGDCTSVLPLNAAAHGGTVPEQAGRSKACRRTVLGWVSRLLQHMVRDCLIPISFYGTVIAVMAVTTPLDVIFCGTIMLVILQLDGLQMNALLTEEQQLELATQFSITVKQQQAQMLQRELLVVFWILWVSLLFTYIVAMLSFGQLLHHPDSRTDFTRTMMWVNYAKYGAVVTNAIASSVFRVWHRDRGTSCKNVFCRFVPDLCMRVVGTMFMFSFVLAMDPLFYSLAPELQAGFGDTEYTTKPYLILTLFGQSY